MLQILLSVACLALAVSAHAQEPAELLAEWPICDVGSGGKLAWHPDGYIVLASSSQKIVVFGLDGSPVRSWGSAGSGPGQFIGLSGVAVGDGGTLFTSEESGRRMQRFTIDGDAIGLWPTGFYPVDVAADGAGHFYIATAGDDDVVKYDLSGAEVTRWPCHPCWAVNADRLGHLYSGTDHSIEKTTTSGGHLWWANVEVDPEYYDGAPNAIHAGASGRVYVSDAGNYKTLVFSSEGKLLQWWPGAVYGLAEDDQGRLYVSTFCSIRVYGFGATPARSATWGRLKQIYR